jgi:hypothetical protein
MRPCWHGPGAPRRCGPPGSSDLAQAQLALRAQLQPHFLFNTLNAVVALVSEDPPAAKRVTVRLAELLRATLAATERSSLPLREELELTRRYLDIEQVRFAERLRVEWSVDADVDCEFRRSSQPLVENARTPNRPCAPRWSGRHLPRAPGGLRLSVRRWPGSGGADARERHGPATCATAGLALRRTRLPRSRATDTGPGAEVVVLIPAV